MPDLKPRPCPFCGADIKPTGKIMRADGKIVWKHGYVGCAIDGSTIVDVETWNSSCAEIDADALRSYMDECSKESRFRVYYGHAESFINAAPTVDAVPVVRCKDCKHRYSDSWCEYVDDDDNFYCARGERKEGADHA